MKHRITVLGSFVVDLMARSSHIPRLGETVKGSIFKMGPGGKGSNQAVAAHRCGGAVSLITKIGKDVFGSVAKDFYQQEGMSIDYVYEDPSLSTGIALIMVDDTTSQNSITVVPGACGSIAVQEVLQAKESIEQSSILLCQLETNLDILSPAVEFVHKKKGIAILNPAPAPTTVLEDSFIGQFDVLTPNETEASILTGIEVVDYQSAYEAAKLLQRKGVKDVIITMGSQGSFLLSKEGDAWIFPPLDVKVVDTTGAGDAFNGGLATALSQEMSLDQAILFATTVAALSVTKVGTAPAMPTSPEVQALLKHIDLQSYKKRFC